MQFLAATNHSGSGLQCQRIVLCVGCPSVLSLSSSSLLHRFFIFFIIFIFFFAFFFSIQRFRFSFCPGFSPLSGSHPILSHFIAFPVRIRESTLHTKFDLQLQVIDSSSVAFRCPLFLPSTLLQVLNNNLSCCLLASIILSGVSCVHIPLFSFTLLSPLYTTTAL